MADVARGAEIGVSGSEGTSANGGITRVSKACEWLIMRNHPLVH
jgi:hypothetical protein